MKKIFLFNTIFSFTMAIGLTFNSHKPQPIEAQQPRFKNGQVLTDATGLNKAIATEDPASDQEISDVFYQYCIIKH